MTAFISVGHYPEKFGASNPGLKLKEHYEACKVVKEIFDRETSFEKQFVMGKRLHEKINFINEFCSDQDIAIEVHFNSSFSGKPRGTETLYYPNSIKGVRLAKIIQEELVQALSLRDRGIKARDDLIFLKSTKIPSVIVEPLFMNNDEAEYLLKNKSYETIADAIIKGIERYYAEENL